MKTMLSSMEIDVDEIDITEVPGYIPVPTTGPKWKKDMVERKNRERLEEYVEELKIKKLEEEKWKDVPDWKRKLLQDKEQQKLDAEMKVKKTEEDRWKDIPEWKRKLLQSKGQKRGQEKDNEPTAPGSEKATEDEEPKEEDPQEEEGGASGSV